MKKKIERYYWKRGNHMASARLGVLPMTSGSKLSKRLETIAESVTLSFNRNKANRIRKARKEVHEGKFVPLDTI